MTKGDRVTRSKLPHWYKPGYAHFVTYRLSGSIPRSLLRQWRTEREITVQTRPSPGVSASEHRYRVHKQAFAKYDQYLDHSARNCWLADESVAGVVRENLHHHHGDKYELLAYCIMPNHVHVLLQPFERILESEQAGSLPYGDRTAPYSDEVSDSQSPLSAIMHSLKSYTANRANQILGRTGQFWQHESYDHWVRDLDELERIVDYIRANPVRAGLCKTPAEWTWSSSADRFRIDGNNSGMIGWLRDDWQRGS